MESLCSMRFLDTYYCFFSRGYYAITMWLVCGNYVIPIPSVRVLYPFWNLYQTYSKGIQICISSVLIVVCGGCDGSDGIAEIELDFIGIQ